MGNRILASAFGSIIASSAMAGTCRLGMGGSQDDDFPMIIAGITHLEDCQAQSAAFPSYSYAYEVMISKKVVAIHLINAGKITTSVPGR